MSDTDLATPLDKSLNTIVAEIRRIGEAAEPVMLGIGDRLAEMLDDLGVIQQDFLELTGALAGDDAAALGKDLRAVSSDSLELSRSVAGGESLATLLAAAEKALIPLRQLRGIGSEVTALSVNAKVLAAQVKAEDVDFYVFTEEIGRLGKKGAEAVDKAEASLSNVRGLLLQTSEVLDRFGHKSLAELPAAAEGLDGAVLSMSTQERAALRVVDELSASSRRIRERISQCVQALQISDLTAQRFEHVTRALEDVEGLSAEDISDAPWADGLDTRHRMALTRVVCGLQAVQYDHARREFSEEISRLKNSLGGLSQEVRGIMEAASGLLRSGSGSGGSIGSEVESRARAARGLLMEYAETRQHICGLMRQVSQEVERMRRDMEEIRSVDADMRVMGLNATFKCGRLGSAGRALGVVASELRSCSRRTEEATEAIKSAMEPMLGLASELVGRADGESRAAAALADLTAELDERLRARTASMEGKHGGLLSDVDRLADHIERTAAAIGIDAVMDARSETVLQGLAAAVESLPEDADAERFVQDRVRRLLSGSYTMAGQRSIHDLFDLEGGVETLDTVTGTVAADPADQSIDDLFF